MPTERDKYGNEYLTDEERAVYIKACDTALDAIDALKYGLTAALVEMNKSSVEDWRNNPDNDLVISLRSEISRAVAGLWPRDRIDELKRSFSGDKSASRDFHVRLGYRTVMDSLIFWQPAEWYDPEQAARFFHPPYKGPTSTSLKKE